MQQKPIQYRKRYRHGNLGSMYRVCAGVQCWHPRQALQGMPGLPSPIGHRIEFPSERTRVLKSHSSRHLFIKALARISSGNCQNNCSFIVPAAVARCSAPGNDQRLREMPARLLLNIFTNFSNSASRLAISLCRIAIVPLAVFK